MVVTASLSTGLLTLSQRLGLVYKVKLPSEAAKARLRIAPA